MSDKEYYISTIGEDGIDLIYSSDVYKLSEIDLINLIKICIVEGRSKQIGKKLMDVYLDSTKHRKKLTSERLNLIGVLENGDREPKRTRKLQRI
jgi:hypothetical protein